MFYTKTTKQTKKTNKLGPLIKLLFKKKIKKSLSVLKFENFFPSLLLIGIQPFSDLPKEKIRVFAAGYHLDCPYFLYCPYRLY